MSGRISKIGDRGVRTVLYEAAHIILTRPVKAGALKSWAMRLAARAGKNKAKVALARKLAAARSHQAAKPPASHAGRRHVVRRRQSGHGQRVDDEEIQRSGDTSSARSEVPSPGRGIRPGREMLSGVKR